MAEADLCGEQVSAEKDAGSAGAAGVFDNGQVAGGATEQARDLPEEAPPDEGRRIARTVETHHTPAKPVESRLRSRRQRMDPVCPEGDPERQFSAGGDHLPGESGGSSRRIRLVCTMEE